MKSLRMTLIALTSIALLAACERSGGGSGSKSSQPQTSKSDTSQKESSADEKQTAEAQTQTQTETDQQTQKSTTTAEDQPQTKTDQQTTVAGVPTDQQTRKDELPVTPPVPQEQTKLEPKQETAPSTVLIPPVIPEKSEPKEPAQNQTIVTRPVTPPEQTTTAQQTTPPVESENEGPLDKAYNSLKHTWDSATNQMSEAASGIKDEVAGLGEDLKDSYFDVQDATRTLVAPTAQEQLRSEVFNEMRNQASEIRDKAVHDSHTAMAATQATPTEQLSAAIKPNDEVSSLLVAMLAEPASDRVHEYSGLIVDEIFNEPEIARTKVMKLQLGLRDLNEQGLYGRDVSDRVAYLQAVLDEKIRDEGSTTLLRDSLIVAGTSVTLGAIAGFHGFDGARRAVTEFSTRRSVAAATDRIGSSFRNTREKIGSLFKRKPAAEEPPATASASPEILETTGRTSIASEVPAVTRGGLRRSLSSIRLSSDKVVQRDVVALGLKPDDVKDLTLQVVPRSGAGFQDYKPTNMPGLRFAVVDQWDDVSLGELRRVVFSVNRYDHLKPRPVLVATRQIPKEEADNIAKQLEFKSPDEGGKEFVMLVDEESGAVTPSRLTVSELEEKGANLTPATTEPVPATTTSPKAKRPRKSSKSVAEAQADGDIPLAVPVAKTKEASVSPVVKSEEVPVPPATADDAAASVAKAEDATVPPVAKADETAEHHPFAARVEDTEPQAPTPDELVAKADSSAEDAVAKAPETAADDVAAKSPEEVQAEEVLAKSPESVGDEATAAALAKTEEPGALQVTQVDEAAATAETRRSGLRVAERTRALKARLRNFDLPWAATVTAATGVPLQLFLLEGYRAGRSYGEGHDALYLESLIPPEEIKRLTVNLSEVPNQE